MEPEHEKIQDVGLHGGARKGAGRKKGAATKKTREIADKLTESGEGTPLEYMLEVMRSEATHEDARVQIAREALKFEAAKSAAPYIHPRLSAVEIDARVKVRSLAEEIAELNDRAN